MNPDPVVPEAQVVETEVFECPHCGKPWQRAYLPPREFFPGEVRGPSACLPGCSRRLPRPRFALGDVVDLERWDETERPSKRIGIARVTKIAADRCESGFMVTVESEAGETLTLDQNWISPLLL